MKRAMTALLAAALASVAAVPATAQTSGEMTLYSNSNYSGARYVVTGQRNILDLGFTVRSVRMANGESWKLCSGEQLRNCTTYRSSTQSIRMDVRSAAPVASGSTKPQPGQFGQSLRGMAAEFFPRPELRGTRIASAGSAAAAKSGADGFCRQAGWSRSANERLETVGGRNYLTDVLCVR